MQIKCEKKRCISGTIVMLLTAVCLLVLKAPMRVAVVMLAAEIITSFLQVDLGRVLNGLLNILYMFASSVVFFYASQRIILDNKNKYLTQERIIHNVLLVFALILLVHAIVNRAQIAIGLVGFVIIVLSTANFYVWNFRKTELYPADILGWRTAQNVASSYHYLHNKQLFYALIFLVILLMTGNCLSKISGRWISRLVSLVLCCFLSVYVYENAKSLVPSTWNREGSQYKGYVLNFMLQIRDSRVEEPESYNQEILEQINETYPKTESIAQTGPTIIAIMNESLADFSLFGDLPSGDDVLPYLHSLQENTVSGYALASVMGGGTATSEYEFLTGNSQAFLPTGSIAYMQYINRKTYSLVSALDDVGYTCLAMHPFTGTGWRREKVYENFGFERFYTRDDFEDPEKIRQFISDEAMYDKIIELYENKGDQPMFLFGVTMQNHGGYDYSGKNFDYEPGTNIYGTGFNDVEQYLILAHESDQAFKKLVDYFSEEEEDVVILMFGDHLPGVNTAVFPQIYGKEFETLDEQMLQYTVPFWVWTNYDSEEQTDVHTSINYLSNYVLNAAGLELPAYNQFLSDIEETIPMMNATSYYSLNDGCMKTLEEADEEEAEALEMYHVAAYNSLFEKSSEKLGMFQ